jgi:hypothetical protein
MNPEQPMNPEDLDQIRREQYHKRELINAKLATLRETVPFTEASQEEGLHVSLSLVDAVESFLDENGDELQSDEELHMLLAKLDTAFAITKDPRANALRLILTEQYGPL